MVKRISIEQSFGWMQRFVAREWTLLLPVMLAFLALPPLAVDLLLPADLRAVFAAPSLTNIDAVAAALAWLLPVMIAVLLAGGVGLLAITALAILPGTSVGEAVRIALRRLPTLVGAALLMMVALMVAAVVLAIVAQMGGVQAARLQALMLVLIFFGMLLTLGRLATLPAVIVAGRDGPIDAILTSWRMANGVFWRMFGALLLYLVGTTIVLLAISTALNALLLLGARAAGAADIGNALVRLVFRVSAGVANTGCYVLVAGFYRQLVGSSSGT